MSLCEGHVECNDRSIISALTCSLVRIRKGCNGVFSSQIVGIPGFKLAVVRTFAKS